MAGRSFGVGLEGVVDVEMLLVGVVILSQWWKPSKRSTSSAFWNDASTFMYIFHLCGYWIGNMQNRPGFGTMRGSYGTGLPKI
ncbi:hypothetical protein U1Q18_021130 [Sarracenia purpurea var. burkii]